MKVIAIFFMLLVAFGLFLTLSPGRAEAESVPGSSL